MNKKCQKCGSTDIAILNRRDALTGKAIDQDMWCRKCGETYVPETKTKKNKPYKSGD